MKTIAKNDYYELAYNEATNCVHWKMKGFWKDMSVVPEFESDWKKVREMVKPGWKILSDASECKVMPDEVKKAKELNQEESLKRGCIKIALIVNSSVTKMSLRKSMEESGMAKIVQYFTSSEYEQAKSWLSE